MTWLSSRAPSFCSLAGTSFLPVMPFPLVPSSWQSPKNSNRDIEMAFYQRNSSSSGCQKKIYSNFSKGLGESEDNPATSCNRDRRGDSHDQHAFHAPGEVNTLHFTYTSSTTQKRAVTVEKYASDSVCLHQDCAFRSEEEKIFGNTVRQSWT